MNQRNYSFLFRLLRPQSSLCNRETTDAKERLSIRGRSCAANDINYIDALLQ